MLQPHMTPAHVAVVEEILSRVSAGPLRVLEWGAGGSSAHFSRFLSERSRPFSWLCVETSPDWANAVRNACDGLPVHVELFDQKIPEHPPHRYQDALKRRPLDDYVAYPSTLGIDFGVILVDGRKRARCIRIAKTVVAPGGVILLHDAQRSYYHQACRGLQIERFHDSGDELWVMRP